MSLNVNGFFGAMGGAVNFNVAPEILKNKSFDVAKKVNEMRKHFEELQKIMSKTEGYWIGEAGDMHRKIYHDLQDKVDKILKRMGEHPKDLLAIAQNYIDVELSIVEDEETLPGDVIV